MAKPLAIALCRVSTLEQVVNNSLNRQQQSVQKAATELDVVIPEDGWWSGNVSSKRGTNLRRKDINEMLARCKKDKRIKYIIVDEPDRFMRSIDEAAYFEVVFGQLGVTVWYASDPDLNKGDLSSKLLKFTKYLSAEGSNLERQTKSINGQTAALKEGRYPFGPKPGYKRGYEKGIKEIDPVKGPALQRVLVAVANKRLTPSQGLVELNRSEFMKGHAPYKMDKFRAILTDPYYSGIVEMDKQVKYRNENGLHEPLITKDQHYVLVEIMSNKRKTQSGPRKNGNPKYPLSNLVTCSSCVQESNGRLVGFDHGNGKQGSPTYEKYRCRSCGRYQMRSELHKGVEATFQDNPITEAGLEAFKLALATVWHRKEDHGEKEAVRLRHKVNSVKLSIAEKVNAATDPSNSSIKADILESIAEAKKELEVLEEELGGTSLRAEADQDKFIDFSVKFVEQMGSRFLDVSRENRVRCKELVFPGGFYIDENKKVYTPEVSLLYSLVTNKKDTEVSDISRMVQDS